MKTALRYVLLLALPILACGPLTSASTATPLPPPAIATTAAPATVTEPIIQCSPPPCPEGVLECPGDCPGGCGTICRAFTPTPGVLPEGLASATPVDIPAPFQPAGYRWALAADGFSQPVLVTHAGDGSGRLFVVEQTGAIRIVASGAILPQPFLDVSSLVSGAFEQGLLGLAFHPDYPATPYFFAYYTDRRGDTQVVRYTVSADPNVADAGSATLILSQDQPYPNHNGGNLVFGPDGYLYTGLGDGGSAGDPQGNAQNLNVLLGKLLRLDVDSGEPYTIPPDNPFAAGGGRPEIWAFGLRNPWRYSFDRATGDLYIGDVGQSDYEEVDFQPAGSPSGQNYGWDFMEGLHPYEGAPPGELIPPIAEYSHSDGCSITGGYVYRGSRLPEVSGVYFYADYCSGNIWTLARNAAGEWQNALAYASGFSVSSFGEDEAGELYVADHNGAVYQLVRQ